MTVTSINRAELSYDSIDQAFPDADPGMVEVKDVRKGLVNLQDN